MAKIESDIVIADNTQCNGKSYPLVMGLLLLFFFFNLNQKKTKIKKQTNSYPGKLGTRLKCVGAKSQGPTFELFR